MRKIILFAFMAMTMGAMAQHVTPLSITLEDVKFDSIRIQHASEPDMLRARLKTVAQQFDKNAEEIKAARTELKVEQAHAKEMKKSLVDAAKMAAALKKLYGKEESELKGMQKSIEKQHKTLSKQQSLNQETRDSYTRLLEQQQKELDYSLREVADRLRAIADLESSIQASQNNLLSYDQEVAKKDADLKALEAQHKAQMDRLKTEQKSAKSMQ